MKFFFSIAQVLLASIAILAQNSPLPLINNPLVPTGVAPGSAGFTLIVNGTGFVSGAIVDWNGSARPTNFISSSRLRAVIPSTDVALAGTAAITVENPNGKPSNVAYFSITNAEASVRVTHNDFASNGPSFDATTGDFNRDGKLDLALVNPCGSSTGCNVPSTVSVLLGNGDGTFRPPLVATVDYGSYGIVAGDFDGDGIPDLAVAACQTDLNCHTSGSLTILRGVGDGSFQNSGIYVVGVGPKFITTGDLNSDGNLDLITMNSGDNTVSVLLGRGDGTFGAPVAFGAGVIPYKGVVGDFNRDGKVDLAVADNGFGAVAVLLGNGDGTFQAPSQNLFAGAAWGLAAADLNGDGILDLVSTDVEHNRLNVYLGNGDGSFKPPQKFLTGNHPTGIAIADLNGDGKLDLVTGAELTGHVFALLGNGDGTFQRGTSLVSDTQPYGVVVGDFNQDGLPDIATANEGTSATTVLLQSSREP